MQRFFSAACAVGLVFAIGVVAMAEEPVADPVVVAANQAKARSDAQKAASEAAIAAQYAQEAERLNAGALKAQKEASDSAAGAIGAGYGGATPPTIDANMLRAPALMLRGTSLSANADALVRDTLAMLPSSLKGGSEKPLTDKKVLLIAGAAGLDTNAWLQFEAGRQITLQELDGALAAADALNPDKPRPAPGPGLLSDLTGIGAAFRALNGVLGYARTEYTFVGETTSLDASEIAAAVGRSLITNGATVVLPEAATPPTEAEARAILEYISAIAIKNGQAKTEILRLKPRADQAKVAAAATGATDSAKQHAELLETIVNRLTVATQRADAFLATLQAGADGKGGLAPILKQWRLQKLVANSDLVVTATGNVAFSGRSKRSLINAIFGPPVDIASATSLTYFVYNKKQELIASGLSRQYEGPHPWREIGRH